MAIEVTLNNKIQSDEEVFALLDDTTLGDFLADQNIATKNVQVLVNDRSVINMNTVLNDGDSIVVSTVKVESGLSPTTHFSVVA